MKKISIRLCKFLTFILCINLKSKMSSVSENLLFLIKFITITRDREREKKTLNSTAANTTRHDDENFNKKSFSSS